MQQDNSIIVGIKLSTMSLSGETLHLLGVHKTCNTLGIILTKRKKKVKSVVFCDKYKRVEIRLHMIMVPVKTN